MRRSPPSAGWSDCSITSLTGAPRMSWLFVTRITAMLPCTDSDGRALMSDLLTALDTAPDLPKLRTPSTGTRSDNPVLVLDHRVGDGCSPSSSRPKRGTSDVEG